MKASRQATLTLNQLHIRRMRITTVETATSSRFRHGTAAAHPRSLSRWSSQPDSGDSASPPDAEPSTQEVTPCNTRRSSWN